MVSTNFQFWSKIWYQNMVPKYHPKISSQNIVPKYRPKIWSPPVLRLFHRACASASTVLRKKAHAHQSIHGKSSICFQSHRRDFWNWVWLHGMRLANLLLLSCSFCFKLKFLSRLCFCCLESTGTLLLVFLVSFNTKKSEKIYDLLKVS